MARVLALTLRMLERQALLERLSAIQRQIVARAPRHEILDAIVRRDARADRRRDRGRCA